MIYQIRKLLRFRVVFSLEHFSIRTSKRGDEAFYVGRKKFCNAKPMLCFCFALPKVNDIDMFTKHKIHAFLKSCFKETNQNEFLLLSNYIHVRIVAMLKCCLKGKVNHAPYFLCR